MAVTGGDLDRTLSAISDYVTVAALGRSEVRVIFSTLSLRKQDECTPRISRCQSEQGEKPWFPLGYFEEVGSLQS